MFELIKSDINRYRALYSSPYVRLGFWITLTYRYGRSINNIRFVPFRNFLLIPYLIIVAVWQFFRCVYISKSTQIGSGLLIFHPQDILIPKDSKIGNNCTMHHDITLGTGPVPGSPIIGNNVSIFPGAKILGGITIGDNVKVGANTVITRDIPSESVVPSPTTRHIPVKLLKKLKFNSIFYGESHSSAQISAVPLM